MRCTPELSVIAIVKASKRFFKNPTLHMKSLKESLVNKTAKFFPPYTAVFFENA